MHEVLFLLCKSIYIFWKGIQYTIHWDKTRVKTNSFGQNERCKKKVVFFLSRAPTHSFTFNLRFLYELKHKVRLSKIVCGIFHFRFRFVFIKVYIFVQQNAWTFWVWKVIIPFIIKITEKRHTALLSHFWFLSCNKKF